MFKINILDNFAQNSIALNVGKTMLVTFILSSLLVFTYDMTTKGINRSVFFFQGMILISIVAATVMMSIGDSLARGLGMLGALSIIRFRTKLDNPRNITFMFASLSIGIACGVQGFEVAIWGILTFCTIAFLISLTPFGNENQLVGTLKVSIPKELKQKIKFEKMLNTFCSGFEIEQFRFLNSITQQVQDENNIIKTIEIPRDHLQEITYNIILKSNIDPSKFTENIRTFEDINSMRLKFDKKPPKL